MTDIILRPYAPGDREAFRSLNLAWIERHFSLETADELVLNDPEGVILAHGGSIVMAQTANGEIAGCCALITAPDGFEIGKMAVAERLRGRGIGKALLNHAIAHARDRGAHRLSLESNASLTPAVHLYEAAGFTHIPAEKVRPSPDARSNVHMELLL